MRTYCLFITRFIFTGTNSFGKKNKYKGNSALTIREIISARKNFVFQENLGFFIPGGFLILPNVENTYNRAKLSALPIQLKEGYPFVLYKSTLLKVLGIIHTHPDIYSEPRPAPINDYQYCYLGIRNYIMDHNNLFEAYKDARGRECYKRLGTRTDYFKIPFAYPDTVHARRESHQ